MFAKVLLVVAFLLAELAHRHVDGFTPKLSFSQRPGIASTHQHAKSGRDNVRTEASKLIPNPSSFQLSSSSHVDGSKPSTGTLGHPIRSRLRQLTGFSLTAFRATMRTATGISMTAVYASTLAFFGSVDASDYEVHSINISSLVSLLCPTPFDSILSSLLYPPQSYRPKPSSGP